MGLLVGARSLWTLKPDEALLARLSVPFKELEGLQTLTGSTVEPAVGKQQGQLGHWGHWTTCTWISRSVIVPSCCGIHILLSFWCLLLISSKKGWERPNHGYQSTVRSQVMSFCFVLAEVCMVSLLIVMYL